MKRRLVSKVLSMFSTRKPEESQRHHYEIFAVKVKQIHQTNISISNWGLGVPMVGIIAFPHYY